MENVSFFARSRRTENVRRSVRRATREFARRFVRLSVCVLTDGYRGSAQVFSSLLRVMATVREQSGCLLSKTRFSRFSNRGPNPSKIGLRMKPS
ncbi:Hypothetical protein NTJ_12016 [Nesidiocoris tenuis]|uniref:Uncharacterized protein n=1 Tax=Nesidiocoris tenuis TaxID=355587 RepID=A0ABN7B5S2_9HEMI|nr:Hypothetical protein NTJ_12016 [Nesidiocoris tenuis]